MTSITPEENSEVRLMDEFYKLCDAGGSIIQIRTREVLRTALTLRKALLNEPNAYAHHEWDVINGFRNFTTENLTNNLLPSSGVDDFFEALMRPLNELREANSAINANPDKVHCFVYLDIDPFIKDNPAATSLLQQYAASLPSRNVCIILITPQVDLANLPMGTLLITDMPTPGLTELKQSLQHILHSSLDGEWEQEQDITEEEIERIAVLGLGMTRYEFETHASLAIVQASINGDAAITADALIEGILAGKTEVVKQSDILELFHSASMEDVGGMDRLKDWVRDRKSSFSDEAREFGIKPPKGLAIVGMPGGGKSLVAKAVAGELGVPLIRLDFGRVFSKYIGDSESRLRAALNMIERMDRLVLFADEIDKGLGGIGGGGSDGGVSSRVLGTFLTWMQENKSSAFVIMTANRIESLPPELFRRGRLDAVFSVGLPTAKERREVLEVHLRKRNRDIREFDAKDLAAFDTASHDYLPAEIECAVNDALVIAYNDEDADDIEMRHIVKALKDMVPMAISHTEQVTRITEWAKKNATPVNYPEGKPTVEVANTSRRRIRSAPTKH